MLLLCSNIIVSVNADEKFDLTDVYSSYNISGISFYDRVSILKKLNVISQSNYVNEDDETLITRREAFTLACNVRGGIDDINFSDDVTRKQTLDYLKNIFGDIDSITTNEDYCLLDQCLEYRLINGRSTDLTYNSKTNADLNCYLTLGEMEQLMLRIKYVNNDDFILYYDYDSPKYNDNAFAKKTDYLKRLYEVIHEPYIYDAYGYRIPGYLVDELITKWSVSNNNGNFNISSAEAVDIAKVIINSRYEGVCDKNKSIITYTADGMYQIYFESIEASGFERIQINVSIQNGMIIDIIEIPKKV